MEENEMKYWLCPKGHVLGMVKRDGSGVRKLWLFEHAFREILPDDEAYAIAVIEGKADIYCTICGGNLRMWVPGEESIKALLERVKAEG